MKRIAGFILIFWVVLTINVLSETLSIRPKESYSDTSTLIKNGIMQEAQDSTYATRLNAINKLVWSASNFKDIYQSDTIKLQQGVELYEKLIADYPDKVMTLEVRRLLQNTYQKLYHATDNDAYRMKVFEVARINLQGIENHMNIYGQSDFFMFSYGEALNAIINHGGDVDKNDITKMIIFHKAKLVDNISENLKSYHCQMLAAIYIYQNEISLAMKLINQGLIETTKTNDTMKKNNYLFLAVWAMGKSHNDVKKDEYYQQLIKNDMHIKNLVDKRIKLLLTINKSDNQKQK